MRLLLATHAVRERHPSGVDILTIHALDIDGIWWTGRVEVEPETDLSHKAIESIYDHDIEKMVNHIFQPVLHDHK